jgi:hypothetical protein
MKACAEGYALTYATTLNKSKVKVKVTLRLAVYCRSGWVCRLQLLLVPASAVILKPESRGARDHILLSQIRDSPNLGGSGLRIYIPQEQGGPVVTPGTGFPFRRLLRLAGLRWEYSTPPPHGIVPQLSSSYSLYSLGADQI